MALQGLEAVKALHRARHKREFAVSRRVLAACRSALADAVAALSLHAKSPAPKPALPLVRVHSEVGEGEELIEAVAEFDPSATEVQQTVYLQEMAGVMPQALAQLLGEEQRGMLAVPREGRLLYLPDIDSGEARGFLHGTAGAAGSAADAREALGGVLRRRGCALSRWNAKYATTSSRCVVSSSVHDSSSMKTAASSAVTPRDSRTSAESPPWCVAMLEKKRGGSVKPAQKAMPPVLGSSVTTLSVMEA